MVLGYIISGCWIFFLLFWLINAPRAKASVERQGAWGIISTRIPLIVGAVLLFRPDVAGTWGMAELGPGSIMRPIGAAVCLCGLAGAIWSRRALADNWSATVTFKQGHELIQGGPYRFVRHPIYTSIITMALGTALAWDRVVSLAAVALYFTGFWLKSKQEEKLLTAHFPEAYPAYRARVKALVPFIF